MAHFFKKNFQLLDWVFNIPNLYQDCSLSPSECEAQQAPLLHSFDRSVNGISQITVPCTPGKRYDGLPDWVWSADGYEFSNFIPSCIDPTYCITDPPVPTYPNANYQIPPNGTLKFADGEVVIYTCQDQGKFLPLTFLSNLSAKIISYNLVVNVCSIFDASYGSFSCSQ